MTDTYTDPETIPTAPLPGSAPAPTDATPAPLAAPAQSFMSTMRVGIDINGDIWQYQGPTLGVVKVGTGAIPQAQSE